MPAIDDATSECLAAPFVPQETTRPSLQILWDEGDIHLPLCRSGRSKPRLAGVSV